MVACEMWVDFNRSSPALMQITSQLYTFYFSEKAFSFSFFNSSVFLVT